MYQWLGDPTAWIQTNLFINSLSTEGQIFAYVAHYNGVDYDNSAVLGQHYEIDLAPFGIPAQAVAIFCRATLIITNDSDTEAEFRAFLYKDGDPNAASWEIHDVSNPHDGIRQSWSDFVPISNGKVHFRWELPNGVNPKQSYGGKLMIHAYCLPIR